MRQRVIWPEAEIVQEAGSWWDAPMATAATNAKEKQRLDQSVHLVLSAMQELVQRRKVRVTCSVDN